MTLPRFKNPIVWTALLCAVLVYSGALHTRGGNKFHCLADVSKVRILRGRIKGNPIRTKTNTSYVVHIIPYQAVDSGGGKYSCKGEVSAFIDKESVEAYRPGGLFTSSLGAGAVLCESGEEVELIGRFGKGGVFSVKKATSLGWGTGARAKVRRLRALCRMHFASLMAFWGNAGGLLLALLSGIREYTETDIREAFKGAGISHILALSGMHLSLVSGVALATSSKALGRKASYAVQAAAITAFVWFAGFTPSLMRAFIMSAMLLFMAVFNVQKKDLFAVLCAVFLLHCAIAPSDMASAAFMLSYGALAGILTAGKASEKVFSQAVPPALCPLLCASIGAQAAVAPISLYLFKEFMPIGIIASVAVSPVVVVFIYLGIALTVLSLIIPPLAVPSGAVLGALYNVIKMLVVFFARFPGLHIA